MSDYDVSGMLSLDAGDMVGGLEDATEAGEDAAEATADLEENVDNTADSFFDLESVNFDAIAAGIGTAGLAGAAQEALDNTQPLREDIGRISEAVDPTTEGVEDLVTALSNETFSQGDATATLGNLAELGIESEDKLENLALTADTLADATGTTAEQVSGELMPALRAMGEDPENLESHMDLLSTLSNETSLSMDDFSRIARKNAEELGDLGLGVEDTAAVMAELEERGLDSRTATRELRQAANDAEGDQQAFMESLELTEETLDEQQTALEDSGASAEDYAASANESFSAADKLGAVVDDLTLKFSGVIQPVSALLPVLTAGGAALAGLGSIGVTAGGVLSALGTAAAVATGPIGLTVAAVAGLVLLFKDDLIPIVEDAVEFVEGSLMPAFEGFAGDALADAQDALEDAEDTFDTVMGAIETRVETVLGIVESAWARHGDEIASEVDQTVKAIRPPIETALGAVENIVDGVLGRIETFWNNHETQIRSIVTTVTNVVDRLFRTGLNNLAEMVKLGLNIIQGDWGEARDNIESIAENVMNLAEDAFRAGFNILDDLTGGRLTDIKNAFGSLTTWISETWDFLASLTKPFRAAYNAIVGNSIVPDLVDGVKNSLGTLRDWLASVWDLHPLSDTFEAAVDAIGEAFGRIDFSPLEDALGTIGDAVGDLIGGLNSLSGVNIDVDIPSFDGVMDRATDIVRGSSGSSGGSSGGGSTPDPVYDDGDDVPVPDNPRGATGLATGGIVTDATRAIVGEGDESEAVMPLSKLEQFVDRPSGGLTIENLVVNASGRREGREAGQALKKELKRFDV